MTPTEVQALPARLGSETADAMESEALEFISWDPVPQARDRLTRDLRERVVCIANALGGVIIVGVADRRQSG